MSEEIHALRCRGVRVVPCSARACEESCLKGELAPVAAETLCLQRLRPGLQLRAAGFCVLKLPLLTSFLMRVLARGNESPARRLRALAHTWLGVCLALLLRDRGVEHIHVHHGYFSSWIAMVAASLLGIGFSMTLHGSDVLLHASYLDIKLEKCAFALTVSDYNRRYLLQRYPQIRPEKIRVLRLGVAVGPPISSEARVRSSDSSLVVLAVGRLHEVKNHAFLIQACSRLKKRGVKVVCLIAGEGVERPGLERFIAGLGLEQEVKLLGHVPHPQLDSYYAMADVVVLTSRSEGVPLTLMEAMALGKIVLAPAITGIPELVIDGVTGFLYHAGCLDHFLAQIETIRHGGSSLHPIREAAREHVLAHFNRDRNLAQFGDFLIAQLREHRESNANEDLVLQQI